MGTWRLKQKNALEKKERGAVHEVCYYIILHIVIHIYIYKIRYVWGGGHDVLIK